MVWPPVTMATQHPDNAGVPWWRKDAFIPTQDEIEELLLLFRELPIDEYMWDWEGKYVDEAVGEKLFSRAREFFLQKPLGEEVHLTYRIPAWEGGKTHRSARAFMNVLSLADLAKEIGLPRPPVTEMFLPLTTSADQPINARKTFRETADYHRAIFHDSEKDEHRLLDHIEVTPLVEDIDSLFSIEKILEPYWKEVMKVKPKEILLKRGQRVFLARSDPAMNSGLVPAVLAVKSALSTAHETAEKLGFIVHPLLGTGSLPFRGSVNPTYTETFLNQYAGTRTYSIQSAFRYDYPLEEVRRALTEMKVEVPKRSVQHVPETDRRKLRELSADFLTFWKPTIEALAPVINLIAPFVPARRERLQHIGLFGYSRGVGKVKLPRAIVFTAALYSLGVPPELIATGRGLKAASEKKLLPLIETYYPALREDLKHAGKFLNRENLDLLARRYDVFEGVKEDIAAIEEILGIRLGPEKPHHIIHRNITSNVFHRIHGTPDPAALTNDVVEAGIIRCSLG
ncbi:MAG: phosphoenolpyruvate carboxylase [Candidatus Peribacteraceae bacterium]|nr:phosphoenolpyruvate carboxylase [Candidatus Peribacteraceae bacterium]MDD5074703.1 phosphoenolpyruvate carboxylase [Candidatus Peribacteraceae bacterium]